MKFKLIFCTVLLFVSLCLAGEASSEEKDKQGRKEEGESENVKQSNDVVPPVPDQQQQQQQLKRLDGDKAGLIKVDLGFIHAFVASLSVIIVSELGDKTFFIAAIMAMRHSRLVVFAGAISALFIMTLLSALLGYATTIIPRWLTYYVSSALFAIFGLKMIRESMKMSADEGQEEYEEVQADIRKKDEEYDGQSEKDVETGIIRTPQRRLLYMFFSRVFIQSLTLTFLAEWGDRSQLATIILAAREEVIGVVLGGTIGHALCTGLAVLGGRFIAQRISIRTVTLIGGVVFLLFALSAFVIHPDD